MHTMNDNHTYLKVVSKTWGRDSHGLFDYESSQIKINNLILSKNCSLIRKRNDVKEMPENHTQDIEEKLLVNVNLDTNIYYLSNPISMGMLPTEDNINDLQNKIWYVIKQEDTSSATNNTVPINSNDLYDIKINDVIKLGRVKYVITEIKLNEKLLSIERDVQYPIFNLICDYVKNTNDNPDRICKVCLSGHEEDDNPMVSLCKCIGSISWVHYQCLKSWMQTKLSIKENEKKTVTSYNMKSFNCEICKTPYPLRFRSENSYFDIIDYTRPVNKNYIILESLNQLKDNNNYKSIQVITLDEGVKILMGRGHDTDVRINDISVSRTHALLYLMNNKIFIKDLKSKFGTLVLIRGKYEITEKIICLQIGRSYLECSQVGLNDYQKFKNDIQLSLIDKSKKKELFQVEKFIDKKDVITNNGKFKVLNNEGMDIDNCKFDDKK